MPSAFTIGDWSVDPSIRTLSGVRGEVRLEPKQMQVLVLLAEHAGKVVSKERLLQTVWANTFVGDEVLSRAISELRRALEDNPKAPGFIQTIPKGGYRLIARVAFRSSSAQEPEPLVPNRPPWPYRFVIWSLAASVVVTSAIWATVQWRHSVRAGANAAFVTVPFTSFPGDEGNPTFSPDGTRIAFDWDPEQEGNTLIYVKMAGDDPPQLLTRGPGSDFGPVWSPDGHSIVFNRRRAGDKSGFYVIPALGGPERRVWPVDWKTGRETCWSGPSWSPDGKRLIFASAPATDLPSASTSVPLCRVTELSLDTLQTRYLTGPLSYGFDTSPRYSPDGRTIAFVRYRSIWMSDIFLMPAKGGTLQRLTHDDAGIPGNLAWMPDSRAIVFTSNRAGRSDALWRIPVTGGEPAPLALNGVDPAIDRGGHRLAFQRSSGVGCSGLYVVDLRNPRNQLAHIAPSDSCDVAPQFSPDGQKLVFASNRAGGDLELWVSEPDGSNPMRLTFFRHGQASTPRWSPDSEWIAFDSSVDVKYGVFIVRAAGGAPKRLTDDGFVPSWSRDGRWIYFASGSSGTDQIWKMPATGGKAVQVTRHGGFGGFESTDGRYLYYTKHTNLSGIWRVPVNGGEEEPVVADQPAASFSRVFVVVANGLYFLDCSNDQQAIAFFDFQTRQRRQVITLPRRALPWGSGMGLSPDGQRLAINLAEGVRGSDIFLVENFQ